MENGHFILEILLLILVIALGFSYSEEVSSNRRLRSQLRRLPVVDKVKADILAMRVQHLEAEIVCKDEEIKRLTKSHQLTEDLLYGSNRPRVVGPITADDIKNEYDRLWAKASVKPFGIKGEWIDEEASIDRKKIAQMENRYKELGTYTHTLTGHIGKEAPTYPQPCADPDCSECYAELNATSLKPKRAHKKKLSNLETDENKTE